MPTRSTVGLVLFACHCTGWPRRKFGILVLFDRLQLIDLARNLFLPRRELVNAASYPLLAAHDPFNALPNGGQIK
jgi:hypothetical protein